MRRRLAELLDLLELNLKLLEAYLVVKDPAAPKSAEAFDGLRMKIDGAYKARRRHLAQLADLDRVLRTTGDAAIAQARVAEFLQGEGVVTITDWTPDAGHVFETVGEVTRDMVAVSPAYVEMFEDVYDVVKMGAAQARPRTDHPAEVQPTESDDAGNGEAPTPVDDASEGGAA